MSNTYEIKGSVKFIGEEQQVSDKFKKRTLVVTTPDGKYPQHVPVDFTQDKCALLDDLLVGDEVNVFFNIRGSEYKDKYYVNLTGWKIDKEGF
jgi:hypothetical protein